MERVLVPNKAWVGEPVFRTNFSNRLPNKTEGTKSVYASVRLKKGKLRPEDTSTMENNTSFQYGHLK